MRNISIALSIALTGSVILTSCDKKVDVEGTWYGTPTHLENVADAARADATLTLVFTNDENSNGKGNISISALIDATQAVDEPTVYIDEPYEVSVAATATISGQWTYEDDEYNDIVLTLNPETLYVVVDPHGVTFSSNILTGYQQPQVDSLTEASVIKWQKDIRNAIATEFYSFKKISDIKIKNGIVSCEVDGRDMTFRK